MNRIEHAPQDVTFDGERLSRAILRLARGAMRDHVLQAEIRIARRQCQTTAKVVEPAAIPDP